MKTSYFILEDIKAGIALKIFLMLQGQLWLRHSVKYRFKWQHRHLLRIDETLMRSMCDRSAK